MKRICIYPKDVQLITGRSERSGRRLINQIRDHLQKDDHQFVTISEFCSYTGLSEEEVRPLIFN